MTADRILVSEERRTRHPRPRSCVLLCIVALSLALVLTPLAWSTELAVVPVDGPSALATELHGINHTGQLVGTFRDAKGIHGLACSPPVDTICSPSFLTPLDLWFNGAKAISTQVQGITTAGQMAGVFLDVTGASHGFLCAGFPTNLACHQVDVTIDPVPMADTLILGLNDRGQLVGHFRDTTGLQHGFTTMAPGGWSAKRVP